MKTYSTSASEVRRTWHVLDAANVPLGRLASKAAGLIRGKHKVTYAPHLDTGDFVVVVNAEQVALTGRKMDQKNYYWHSQYPGGLKTRSVREQMDRNPARIVERAVFGMLPHNRLGDSLHGHLKVYVGPSHPHEAQVNGPAQPALSQPPPESRRRKKQATARRGAATAARVAAATPALSTRPAAVPAEPEPVASISGTPVELAPILVETEPLSNEGVTVAEASAEVAPSEPQTQADVTAAEASAETEETGA